MAKKRGGTEYYSDLYKRMIHGRETCPFWDLQKGGSCYGRPGARIQRCIASPSGEGCPIYKFDQSEEV